MSGRLLLVQGTCLNVFLKKTTRLKQLLKRIYEKSKEFFIRVDEFLYMILVFYGVGVSGMHEHVDYLQNYHGDICNQQKRADGVKVKIVAHKHNAVD